MHTNSNVYSILISWEPVEPELLQGILAVDYLHYTCQPVDMQIGLIARHKTII